MCVGGNVHLLEIHGKSCFTGAPDPDCPPSASAATVTVNLPHSAVHAGTGACYVHTTAAVAHAMAGRLRCRPARIGQRACRLAAVALWGRHAAAHGHAHAVRCECTSHQCTAGVATVNENIGCTIQTYQVLQLLGRLAHNVGASSKANALHATIRCAVQRLVDEGTHEAAPQLLHELLGFTGGVAGDDANQGPLLAAALQVVATLLQLDEACRAAAVHNDDHARDVLHTVMQLCTRCSVRCGRAALEVLYSLVCAARDYQCTDLCQRVLEAGTTASVVSLRYIYGQCVTEAMPMLLQVTSPHCTRALQTLHAAFEGCAHPPDALDGTGMLLLHAMHALEWAPHTPSTVPVGGADAAARAALTLFASLLEGQCTAILVALLDPPATDMPNGGLAQVLLTLADACSRDPAAGALQGVLPWPCPSAPSATHVPTCALGWAAAPLVARRRYWAACVRLCEESLVLLRALLTHTSTGLAAVDDLLATSEAARHALVTVTRLQSWQGGGVDDLPLPAWVLRADSVERNPLLQGGQDASVEVVGTLATSLHRRVLLSMEGAAMDAG